MREQFYRLPARAYQQVRELVESLADSSFPPRPTRVGGLGEPAYVYTGAVDGHLVHYEVDLGARRIVITRLEETPAAAAGAPSRESNG